MRHQKSGKKLGRTSAHRNALWSNMVSSLIEHEKIQTTQVKAKELRRHVERIITWAVSVSDVLAKPVDMRNAEEKSRIVHAMRMSGRVVKKRETLTRLFEVIGPRFAKRPGGYTRIIKVGYRHGDCAPTARVELV